MGSRLFWFLLGCAIGIVIGYIVRSLREIKDKVTEVDKRLKNDKGLVRYPLIMDLVLLIVVSMTVYASILSQRSSNEVREQQARNTHVADCTTQFLSATITALNARTEFSTEQNAANLELQKAQSVFLTALSKLDENSPPDSGAKVLRQYLSALGHYTLIASKANTQVVNNPFPTAHAFGDCINAK